MSQELAILLLPITTIIGLLFLMDLKLNFEFWFLILSNLCKTFGFDLILVEQLSELLLPMSIVFLNYLYRF